MGICDSIRKMFLTLIEYDTKRYVHIKDKRIGSLALFMNLVVVVYVIVYVLIIEKGYQTTDTVVSVVTTKVKGIAYTGDIPHQDLRVAPTDPAYYQRIWDPADCVFPPTGDENGGFFVMTNLVITPSQSRGVCAEDPKLKKAQCVHSRDCKKGESIEIGNGVMTGNCIPSILPNISTCEVEAWCPVEDDKLPLGKIALLEETKDFTVLIKNQIEFPRFGPEFHRRNIFDDFNSSYLKTCTHHNDKNPHCPVFRLGDIVEKAGHNYSEVAVTGAVFSVKIKWKCDLDYDFLKYCLPQYSFHRMDDPQAVIATGFNFRSAQYYEHNRRTLFKRFGIKFLIIVEGEAGKFNLIKFFLNVGSGLALLGITTVICDLIVLYLFKAKNHYRKKKYLNTVEPENGGDDQDDDSVVEDAHVEERKKDYRNNKRVIIVVNNERS